MPQPHPPHPALASQRRALTLSAAALGLAALRPHWALAQAQAASPCQAAPAGLPASGARPGYLQGAVAVPAARQLRYEGPVTYKGIDAKARSTWAWQHDGQQYQLLVKTKLLFLELSESSSGSIGPEGLRPSRYERVGRGARSATFDARQQRIAFDNGTCAQLVAGVQDSLSVFVQLAAMLAGAPGKYPKGSTLLLPVAQNRALRAWTFKVDGEEVLNLRGSPSGPLRCLRLVRAGEHPAQVWLAPSLDYWPVRVKVQQDGEDGLDQSLRF